LCSLSSTEPAATAIYSLSLHDALPIYTLGLLGVQLISGLSTFSHKQLSLKDTRICPYQTARISIFRLDFHHPKIESLYTKNRNSDRKSTRLNSSHVKISYAVFCLKKKK